MRDYRFGDFLRERRTLMGLTQYQLGRLVGVSDKAVSKWENGSAKPQSGILYKLGEVLGISVDELLSCRQYPGEPQMANGVFATKKQVWSKAFDKLRQRYGGSAPVEITSRFFAEQAAMQGADAIVCFDALSVLAAEAEKNAEHIGVRGNAGASLAAYLLGATDINPLKPHYYCPSCHAVVFSDDADDGWDLPARSCACGHAMCADGHDIPYETISIPPSTSFTIAVSPRFLFPAKAVIAEYFKDCRVVWEDKVPDQVIHVTIDSATSRCSMTLCADEELARCRALEQATAVRSAAVPFYDRRVLNEFQECHTDGISEFETDFVKNMLRAVRPDSFRELIQILGWSHGMGTWDGSGAESAERCYPVGRPVAYREDVFRYIREKTAARGLADTGLARRVMEDTRRGVYAKSGMPENIRRNLEAIGAEEWFVESIGKIGYLFPKAHGVAALRTAATMMWYKLAYPKEFREIILLENIGNK